MNHVKADFSKIELVQCLYHRTYQTFPDATLQVSIDGVKKEYRIRKRAAKRDNLYHSAGLNCVLVVYDGIVLAYEIIKSDIPATTLNIQNLMQYANEDWYFDRERFYKLDTHASSKFISIQQLSVIDPIHLTYSSTIAIVENDCFVVCQNHQIILQTPPISTTLEKKEKAFLLLDNEQEKMYLSLTALLKMCNVVSRLYGGEAIEQFDIPQYMIRHKTVNLAKLPQYVRDNSTTALKPVEAISYLLGLIHKETDSNNVVALTKVLRTMCVIGITNVDNTRSENVYKDKKIELKKINFDDLIGKYDEDDQTLIDENNHINGED